MSVLGLAREHAEEVALHLDVKGEAKSDLQRFTSAFFRDALPEELRGLDAPGMAEIAAFAWETAEARQPGQPHIRLETLKGEADTPVHRRTALCIVNDDMPFLVDSVAAALAARSLTVDRIVHPVIDVRRDAEGARVETVGPRHGSHPAEGVVRESVIYIELERVSAKARQELLTDLEVILADVRAAVEDWKPMLAALAGAAEDLGRNPPPVSAEEQAEAVAFLQWMSKDNFTLLGYRYYSYDGDLGDETLEPKSENGLGYLRDPAYPVWRGPEGYTTVSPQLRHFLATPEPVLITKSNAMSTVHRRIHMDYVGVKAFRNGRVVGEHRFIGLFTSMSYATSPRQVPLLRRKVEKVLDACGFDPKGHAGKALLHVLENFPRDEMFQIDPEQLTGVALGLLSLIDRPRPKLFVRRDRFERYVSVLTYIPRDLYRSDIRETVGRMLTAAFRARLSLFSVELRDDAMARIHFILGTTPGSVPHADEDDLNRRLRALVLGWDDQLETALAETLGEARAARLRLSHGRLLSASYRAQYSPGEAALDIERLIALRDEDDRDVLIYRRHDDPRHQIRLKIFSMGSIIPLSECVPVLEHLGLKVIEEYPFDLAEGKHGWIHDFLLADPHEQPLDLDWLKTTLEPALRAILGGDQEDDGFNALVIKVNLSVEKAGLFRAYFRYMRQIGLPYGQDTVQAALIGYPRLTSALADLFAARFDPNLASPEQEASILTDIENELARVEALADDRILRLYRSVILATVRTNAYQPERPALAFKINSSQVPGLPLPVPYREIFVYSPRVEGIHLRGGKVARGGLRWSDRRDDFRTEVLSLLKAQMVKNAVIVPVGAKGGFYAKQLPPASDREAWLAEGKEAYKIFIRSLLTVTDNLVEGEVVPPLDVVRHDDDDPYLVVAADKGTATFSDIANAISIERGHWLGDAFASGGSKGYDHKEMGITARGAWISVERHFREMGINVATDSVRAVGVGDMSGDVFGNGMLRSRALKLVAAFDHRHIFLDPNPDPEKSFIERERLFNLPRSSWADYDASLISEGGGVFPRTAKSIDLTPEIQAMLGISEASLSPVELIRAVLKMEADLLWMGGIGTYVKAAAEPHTAAGDKANDPVRIDGEELRVKVVGEGANLGFTQGARIAFARKGGRINTDFIDNSAGVDCSDNEVNIKILLNPIVASGRLPMEERDRLLVDMTDNVADIVLRDNYLQTQALSVAEIGGAHAVPAYARLIQTLEATGHLNRSVEGLPTDEELERRITAGEGLTRPELAVLMAYSKLRINEALMGSPVLDDPTVEAELIEAFPPQLQERFPQEICNHSLRHELIATKLSNAIVNRGGITLAFELAEETGASLDQVVGAFVVAREVFGTRSLWRMIDSYDYRIPAEVQMRLHRETAGALKRQIEDILRFSGEALEPSAMIARLKPGIDRLVPQVSGLLRPEPRAMVEHYRQTLLERGTPADVLEPLVLLVVLNGGVGVALLAEELGLDEADIAHAYTLLGDRLGLDWAAGMASSLMPADPWERLLLAGTAHDFERVRLELIRRLVSGGTITSAQAAVEAWLVEQEACANRVRTLVQNVRASKPATTAKLTHLASQVRQQLTR